MLMDVSYVRDVIVTGIPWGAVIFASLLIMVDYFTGIVVAALQRTLTSSEMREGLLRKLLLFLALIMGVLLKGFFLFADLPHTVTDVFGLGQVMDWFETESVAEMPVCLFVCTAICLMEVFSIVENVAKVNSGAARLLSHFQAATGLGDKESKEEKESK